MTYGGAPLDNWEVKLCSFNSKQKFIVSMLRQIILCLQKLHRLGYSHGDLKPQNICARKSHDGSVKFTLIDLGMSAKLTSLGSKDIKQVFRGNMMFASADHIISHRASALCDLYSLLCVSYFFLNKTLPWLDEVIVQNKKTGRNYYK